ncbi:Similar to DNA-binding protein P3A2 (Strongylocentrotus purpuratus) [Cotesia congregata]|uniref:Similar to DNA-binding protein P3A2 (Strongylocentrotus purpuratus) n=1 Tax=Cotesia congregata TaxID=51543 RepID=A0A8J2HMS1_COTCN|nr:Similar to DNA-binding protein P3A2 (Strongylocentrotus purpuratus) [Cotesia congregata]
MRYSAVQEDGYGVGLRQDIQPNNNNNNNNISNNNVDDSMMAATGEVEPVGESTADECSMVYNLPLLFANGYPTSLEKITLPQLEKFITFMTRCSLGNNTTQVLNKPAWWPTEVEFSIPLVRPKKSGDSWMRCLRRVVLQCYSFHQSEYLLRFCTYLAQYPQAKLYYVNNWDSTTSLYHKSTGKLLATFRNENMDYDKVIEPHRKSLLPINNANSNSQAKHKKTQQRNHRQSPSSLVRIQPQMEEIYLCDNCDAEFLDLKQMKDHEKSCGETVKTVHQETSTCWRPMTPEVEAEPDLTQNQFMEYFHLSTPNQQPPKTTTDPSSIPAISIETEPSRSSRRMKPSANLCRSSTIPFSSPAGLALVKKSKGMNEATKRDRVDRIEWHLSAPALTKTNRPKWFGKFSSSGRWVVTYKPNTSKENPQTDDYVHQYTFGAVRRKPSLDVRSQILYIACGSPFVKLNRLTDEQLQDLKEHPWKYQPPIRKIRHRIRPRLIMRISGKSTGQKRQYSSRLTEVMPIIEQGPEINQIKKGSLKRGYTPNFRSRPSMVPISRIPSSTPTIEEPLNKTIVIVDLCSSDEEEIPSNCVILSDENRDPLNSTFENVRMSNSFSKNLGLQPMNDRLRDSILTDDNDKSCNKRLTNGVIDAFSPILKPTP